MVEYKKPTKQLIDELTYKMRDQDVNELKAAHDKSIYEVLIESIEVSRYADIVFIDGDLVGIIGLRDMSKFSVPWFLGTDFVNVHRKVFMRESKKIIDSMPPKLLNMVHAENKVSIRWLKALGFTLDDPITVGENELFHTFHRGFENV